MGNRRVQSLHGRAARRRLAPGLRDERNSKNGCPQPQRRDPTMKLLSTLMVSCALSLAALAPSAALADDTNQIAMDQLPKPVRETIQREAQGGRVDEVSKISDDGHLFKAEIK